MNAFARRAVACLVLVSLAPASGCSFIFVRRPHKDAPNREAARCTSSRAAPFVDAVGTTFFGLGTYSALRADDQDYVGTGVTRDSAIISSAVWLAVFATSAMYGFATVASCRALPPADKNPYPANPYQQRETKRTHDERAAEEAAEEAAVQERQNAKAAADAKAAGEAAQRAAPPPPAAAPAKAP